MRGEMTFEAYWDQMNRASVYLKSDYYGGETTTLKLMPDGDLLKIHSVLQNDQYTAYEVMLPPLSFESRYHLEDDRGLKTPLKFGRVVQSAQFDQHFATDQPLGATLNDDRATFALWAPTAEQVYVKLFTTTGNQLTEVHQLVPMIRGEKGVWQVKIDGGKPWLAYRFLVCVDGICKEAQDPYGYTTLPNAQASVIINGDNTLAEFWQGPDSFSALDAVIYEVSVRDITQHPSSGARYPGTYEALATKGLNYHGKPVGRDYLRDLGITHVQLLPIYDFGSVDETNPRVRYNWGYDPIQYFCPEGSLSANPLDPVQRVEGVKKMVKALHADGLGVIMDVVYNHMFDRDTSPLELVVPGYYFRLDAQGKPSNGSFCGNDLDSTKKMTRRLVLDCTRHWMTTYGIDGFRFDLMGILDKETMGAVSRLVGEINPRGLVYGEGWNMPTALDDEVKAIMHHAQHLPGIGFFNDRYRDFYKGATMTEKVGEKGLLTGAKALRAGWKHNSGFGELFFSQDIGQHVQYMECHDNHTLWDKLAACCGELSVANRRQLQISLNGFLGLSFGIPFFHCGQEWFRSKDGDHNSYRSGDDVNAVDWALVHQGEAGVKSLKEVLLVRRQMPIFKERDLKVVLPLVVRKIGATGLLELTVKGQFTMFFNLSNKRIALPKSEGVLVFSTEGAIVSEDFLIPFAMRVLSHL